MYVRITRCVRETNDGPWVINGIGLTVTAAKVSQILHGSVRVQKGIGLRVTDQIRISHDLAAVVDAIGLGEVPAKRTQILHRMHHVPDKSMGLEQARSGILNVSIGRSYDLLGKVASERSAIGAAKRAQVTACMAVSPKTKDEPTNCVAFPVALLKFSPSASELLPPKVPRSCMPDAVVNKKASVVPLPVSERPTICNPSLIALPKLLQNGQLAPPNVPKSVWVKSTFTLPVNAWEAPSPFTVVPTPWLGLFTSFTVPPPSVPRSTGVYLTCALAGKPSPTTTNNPSPIKLA